jgi:hypothetical protein
VERGRRLNSLYKYIVDGVLLLLRSVLVENPGGVVLAEGNLRKCCLLRRRHPSNLGSGGLTMGSANHPGHVIFSSDMVQFALI